MMRTAAKPQSVYSIDDERKELWVYLEHHAGELEGVSLEILGKARELADRAGWPLIGLLCGSDLSGLAPQAVAAGADEVRLAEHDLLNDFTVEAFAEVIGRALIEARPSVFLAGATPDGRDLAGRLAVRLMTGLNADCTDLSLNPDTGALTSEVTGFGGGVLALLEIPRRRPQMATVRPGVFPPPAFEAARSGSIVRIPVELRPETIRSRVVERDVGRRVDLTQASVLVCGGRGVNGDFATLHELAELLGGEVGATRPAVDQGYLERERQIGQTGVVCRPKVALAVGISGAFHFTVGIERADVIVAINNDPEAPIFEVADYGIVGDAATIVPALIQVLQLERVRSHA
jgi:electron transfer flavoprotein alpha subunit